MAIPHNARPWDETPEPFEDFNPDDEYASDINALLANVPTGEDFFLEELYEDTQSGTMFDTLDD